jgi:twinkle protein
MSQWHYEACPKCPSSDAFAYKDADEWGHCFSCGQGSRIEGSESVTTAKKKAPTAHQDDVGHMETIDINQFDVRGFQERNIRKNISAHYGVRVSYDADGTINSHFYPYTKKGNIVGYKERQLPKKFAIHGDAKGKGLEMFGQSQATGGKILVITEGELDCLAVAQAQFDKYQKFYPVVSIPSASQTNILIENREWIRGFQEVILMFDNDEPGQKAVTEAAKIIGFDKVKVANLSEKDPCDVLLKHGSEALMSAVWGATTYSPAGIVKGEDIWDQYKQVNDVEAIPYPECMGGLNPLLKGMRDGEIVLLTSGTGAGKSTVTKEIILNLRDNYADQMVGIISLEESVGDTAQKLIGMELKTNPEENDIPDEEARKAYEKLFADEKCLLLDHQGSVSDDSLIDKIEYLCLMGCKKLFLDHITIAVSEGADGKTGNEAIDYVMSALLKVVKKHNVWLGIISHLRKGPDRKPFEEGYLPSVDDIKGSGSIKQISFDIIAFARNMTSEDEVIKNTIKFRVLKARKTGRTGDAGESFYDHKTTRLRKVDMDFGA